MKRKVYVLLAIVILIASFFLGEQGSGKTSDSSINSENGSQEINVEESQKKDEIINDKEPLTQNEIHSEKISPEGIEKIQNESIKPFSEDIDDAKDVVATETQDLITDDKNELTCTLTVSSETILDNLDKLDQNKLQLLPEDGIIYKTQTVKFAEGDSVFDILQREMQNNKIHMEFTKAPNMDAYIEGINNIYEFDCGELSGWMYKVNNEFPNISSSQYILKDNDNIEWLYSCDLGPDIGKKIEGGEGQ